MNSGLCAMGALVSAGVCASLVAQVELQRFQLDNGVRVVVGHVPDAPRQSTFTFLPLTMMNDEAGCAQWSHLLEHLLIRSTDPQALNVPGIQLNGETTQNYLRLDTSAEPAHWIEALGRHAQWLAARRFDPAVLEREKATIAQEEQHTAVAGLTTKFALAAWNQVARHGLKHAAVHQDVADAAIEDVQAYAQTWAPVDESVLIATIGPATFEQTKVEIEKLFGALQVKPAKPHAATQTENAGSQAATWDLPTRHVIWWWKLPDRSPATLAAATAIGSSINIISRNTPSLQDHLRQVQAFPCLSISEGPFFMLDCCLKDGVKQQDVWTHVQALLEQLREGRARHSAIAANRQMLLQELGVGLTFNAMRTQLPAHMRDNAEGVWLLGLMNYEYAWGVPATQAIGALQTHDAQAVKALLDQLNHEPLGALMIEPATPPATKPAS